MRHYWMIVLMMILLGWMAPASASCPETLAFEIRPLAHRQPIDLCERYRGKVVLVVNTASRCVFTDQYEGLEALYERYKERGLVVLGFPSNDFGGQEPGTEEQIKRFCRISYGIQFPMFAKMRVASPSAHPFYRKLAALAGEYPAWNFHKYLLARDGKLAASFQSHVRPNDPKLSNAIERELKKREPS